MSTPTFAVVVDNPTDQAIVTTTVVVDYQNWFNVAYPLQIRWKSEDTSFLVTGTGEPAARPTKGSGGGLSVSSIVIIAMVCTLIVISAVIATVLWVRQRKLKQQPAVLTPESIRIGTVDGIQQLPPELHGQAVLIPFLLQPLDSQRRITDHNQKPVELPTSNMN
ncbi:hypothetical protein Q9L58_002143 [Maublancomyces gigas]|uniref:Uncharacterized protein n=1 Tax=Discina gigas TaxID=1032678 RepID=A0ABR3GSL7_9PEZI